MEVTDGNDGALAAGIALATTMHSFVCTHETSHVGTDMAHRVRNSSTALKKMHTLPTKERRAAGRDIIININSRLDVGLPPTKLLLPLTEQSRITDRFCLGNVSQ